MPNPIYLQQKANPWEAMLPQLLGNLFLAKVKHGWDMETAAEQAKTTTQEYIKKETFQKDLEVKTDAAKKENVWTSNLYKIGGRVFKPEEIQPSLGVSPGDSPGELQGGTATTNVPTTPPVTFGDYNLKMVNGKIVGIPKDYNPITLEKEKVASETQPLLIDGKNVMANIIKNDRGEITKIEIAGETKQADSDAALRDRAIKGDKQAQAILASQKADKIEIASVTGAARGAAFAKSRTVNMYDTKEKRFVTTNLAAVDDLNASEPGRMISESSAKIAMPEVREQAADASAIKAFAKVPASQRGASVITASGLMDKELPEIIALREKVEAKNLLPSGGLKDIESLNQWYGEKISDPDAALLRKKVKFLADSLQRTIGGSQGGEWAFKVAADILDPSFTGPAFKNVVTSHATALRRMSEGYLNFKENLPGRITSQPTPSKTKTIIERRQAKDGRTLVKYSDGSIGEE